MRIIQTNTYTVENGDVIKLPLCGNKPGDTVVGETYFQTSANVPFSVTVTADGENYQAVKVVNMGTYALVDSVINAGYYMIPCGGLKEAKLTFTGDGEIFIKEVF